MTRAKRVAWGALFGAVLALLLHDASRNFLRVAFQFYGPSHAIESSNLLRENIDILPAPNDVMLASVWMQTGANRLNRRTPISKENLRSLRAVALGGAKSDVQNGFWLQMAALFSHELGEPGEAMRYWDLASNCLTWNDYQSARFSAVQEKCVAESGIQAAWHPVRLYYTRSDDTAKAIESYASQLIARAGFDDEKSLHIRATILRNGKLLRDGSRSLKVGTYGVNMVEFASYRSRSLIESSPRKLLVSRYSLINQMRAHDLSAEAEVANRAFAENEGWLAMFDQEDLDNSVWWDSIVSAVSGSVPSSLFVTGLIGGLMWIVMAVVIKFPALHAMLRPPVAPLLGIALAAIIYWFTSLGLLAITIVLCFAFLAYGPTHERSKPDPEFGLLFSFTIALLATVFTVLITAFIAGLTTPAVEVFHAINIDADYFDGSFLFLGLGLIVISLLALLAPFWAIVRKVGTPYVAIIALRQFSAWVCLLGFILSVITIPIAVTWNKQTEPKLTKIMQNEPSYYVLQ